MNEGLQISENNIDLIILKSEILKSIEDSHSSLKYLEGQILVQKDFAPELHARVADLKYEIFDVDECLSYLFSLPSEMDDEPILLNTRAKYQEIAGDFQKAKSLLERSNRIDPENAQTIAKLGNFYRIQGDLDQAVNFYLRAINLDPSDENLFIHLFEIYNDRRDFGAARDTLEKAVIAIPASSELRIRLAKFLFQHGLLRQAKDKIDQAIRQNPHDEELRSLQRMISQHNLTEVNEWQLAVD